MKVGYLTKRKDACWWVRILNPMSALNSNGHEAIDEVFEHTFVCQKCRSGVQLEFQLDDERRKFCCPGCDFVFMGEGEVAAWRAKVDSLIENSEIIVFQRPTNLSHLRLIRRVKAMGKVTVQTADDNYIDVPDWNTGYDYYKARRGIIEATLREVDGIDVTVQPLKDRYSEYNKNIAVLPNCQDIQIIDATPPAPDFLVMQRTLQGNAAPIPSKQFFEMREGKKFMVWGGSPTHKKDLELIVSSCRRIVRQESVCFGFFGYVHSALLEVIPSDRLFLFPIKSASEYFMFYKALKADFGLAPVCDVTFNRGKSSNKAIEYQILNIMPIMSNFVTYQGCSPKGIYAENTEFGWFKAFREAIQMEKSDYDSRIKENRLFVEENHDIQKKYPMWIDFYEKLLEEKKK